MLRGGFIFPVKKTIVPLDACNHVRFTLNDFKLIKKRALKNVLVKMAKPYINNILDDEGIKAALMYDPLTVYYLINPKVCRTYKANVQVETKGILTRGMTVADLRIKSEVEENTIIVDYIDEKNFKDYFIETLSKS